MMQRIVSLILMTLLLVGQTFCAAHTHAGSGVAEPDGHTERPHIHVGQHRHHHHGHDHEGEKPDRQSPRIPPEDLPPEDLPVDHDSDAIYGSPNQLFRDVRTTTVDVSKLALGSMSESDPVSIPNPRPGATRGSLHSAGSLKCPLYLWTLSIRC